MEELVKWIIENKALIIIACITLSLSIPISIHFGKTIINNNIKKNKTINNYKNQTQNQPNLNNTYKNNQHLTTSKNGTKVDSGVELTKISLYSTGKKGKVYTTNFYKSMNHNFGIEITLKNNTYVLQNIKVGWCIYKDGNVIVKGTFNKKVNPNSISTTDFFVQEKTFNNLKVGKYKSLFWVNDVRVQKVYFTILNK